MHDGKPECQPNIYTAPSPFSAKMKISTFHKGFGALSYFAVRVCLPVHTCVCVCVFFYADIKKMPLGKLSKMQIAKGFEVLEEIEAAMTQRRGNTRLEELSSKFFTTIPHNFGRNRPPTINSKEVVEQKKEMLMVRLFFFFKDAAALR